MIKLIFFAMSLVSFVLYRAEKLHPGNQSKRNGSSVKDKEQIGTIMNQGNANFEDSANPFHLTSLKKKNVSSYDITFLDYNKH
jgi:hypothetical protein